MTNQTRRRDDTEKQVTNTVGVLECPAVDTIVCHIQATLWKPGDVALFKVARPHSLKGPVPVQRLAGNLYVQ
jgi:hypothetical protein